MLNGKLDKKKPYLKSNPLFGLLNNLCLSEIENIIK